MHLNILESWKSNKIAGKDWFCGFMGQHPTLSLRSPEATSFGRATSFKKTNGAAFLKNLNLHKQYKFTPDRIYNCNETRVITVHNLPKVVAARGNK